MLSQLKLITKCFGMVWWQCPCIRSVFVGCFLNAFCHRHGSKSWKCWLGKRHNVSQEGSSWLLWQSQQCRHGPHGKDHHDQVALPKFDEVCASPGRNSGKFVTIHLTRGSQPYRLQFETTPMSTAERKREREIRQLTGLQSYSAEWRCVPFSEPSPHRNK